jgi:hypothetical protein
MTGVQRTGARDNCTCCADIKRFCEVEKCCAGTIDAPDEDGNLEMDTGRASALGWR